MSRESDVLVEGSKPDVLSEAPSQAGWRPRAVEEGGYEVLFVVEPEALVSRDSGATWTFHRAGLPRSSVYALAPLGPAGVLAAGTSRGLFLSRDHGLTWRAMDEASRLPPITSIAVSREGNELFAGTLGAGVVRVPLPPE